MKKQDSKKDFTNLLLLTFRWDEFAKLGLGKNGPVRRKHHKTDEPRWCALVFNYLLFYRHKKGQPPQSGTDDIWIDGMYIDVLQLRNIAPASDGKSFGFQFEDASGRTSGLVQCFVENWEEQEDWIKKIHKHIRDTQKSLGDLATYGGGEAVLNKMMRDVPRGLTVTAPQQPDGVSMFAETLKRYYELVQNYVGQAGLLKNFADFYTTNSRQYIDWIMGVGGGDDYSAERYLKSIETKELDKWTKRTTMLLEQLQQLADTRFFREDLEPELKRIDQALQWLDAADTYNLIVYEQDARPLLTAERYLLKVYATYFQAVPKSRDLTLESIGPGTGQIRQRDKPKEKAEIWSWAVDKNPKPGASTTPFRLECQTYSNVPAWTCPLGSEFVSEGWGAVLWNRASWVWFHPKIRFVVRYDWSSTERLFRFHHAKKKQPGELVLPDWRWTGTDLEPVMSERVEKRDFEVWTTQKQVPAIVVLLVATLFSLQEACAKLLPNVQPPTRVHKDIAEAVYYRPFSAQ